MNEHDRELVEYLHSSENTDKWKRLREYMDQAIAEIEEARNK